VENVADLVREKVLTRKPAVRVDKQRVATILHRCIASIVADWLARAKMSSELSHLSLSDDERTGHLPKLVEDLVVRLSKPIASVKDSDAAFSEAAIAHGKLRYLQGYTPAMLVHESRILQVTPLRDVATRSCYPYQLHSICANHGPSYLNLHDCTTLISQTLSAGPTISAQ
jgi:hypothetical protein